MWAQSPFIVPVAAFAMVLGIVIAAKVHCYHTRRLLNSERLAAIARGLPLPPENTRASDPRRAAARTRQVAIILIAVGIGVGITFCLLAWVERERDILSAAAFAAIPLTIGVGMLYDYRLQTRDLGQGQTFQDHIAA